jgi:hypothetical protein
MGFNDSPKHFWYWMFAASHNSEVYMAHRINNL